MESKIPMMSTRVSNALNIPPRQTSDCRPELRGRPRCNVMFPSEQYSESPNDYNDETISGHEFLFLLLLK